MTEFRWDIPQNRPEPDKELMARAHNLMLATETPQQRYVRQQWECAMAASRVALDAWRRVWPLEAADSLTEDGQDRARDVESALAAAYFRLDSLSEELDGLRHEVQTGGITSHDLAEMERERKEQGSDQA